MSDTVYDPMYDPRQQKQKDDPIPLDLLPRIAQRNLNNPPVDTFKAVVSTAIDGGMTSAQTLTELFGREVVRSVQSDKGAPSPAKRSLVLAFIAGLDPETATGRKEPWRHQAKPREREIAIY